MAAHSHKEADEKIYRLNRVYAMQSAVSRAIVHVRDRDKLFDEVCRIAVELGRFRMAWIGDVSTETSLVKPVTKCGFDEGYLNLIHTAGGESPLDLGQGPTIRTGTHVVCNDIIAEPDTVALRDEALKRGYRSYASFPLLVNANVTGVVTVYADAPGFFDEEEVRLLDELSLDISFALEFLEKEKRHKKADELALQARLDWEETFDTITDMITVHDKDFNVIRANKAAKKILGLELLNTGKDKCYQHYHGSECPPEGCPSCLSLVSGKPTTVEFFEPHLNLFLEICAIPRHDARNNISGLIHVVRDITEQKKLEAQLRHAQKMEALGTLTGGIAHDFNNILTAIVGYANIIKLKIRQDDPVRQFVEQIVVSTERAASLTQGLLAFSRKVVVNPQPINLNESVERIEKLMGRLIRENIVLKTAFTGRITTVVADSSQLEQVLMNLITNASDAMPEGGTLTLSTDLTELGDEFITAHGYGKTGAYATITVTDTGLGMDDATRNRIFEPFFTTKEVGKGTGLGLSIVYGIVKQHNGYIVCTSKPQQGTSFVVYLPLAKAALQGSASKEAASFKGGTETILVAEDDPEIRRLMKTILTDFGYTVIIAENGADAVLKFRENKDTINLLLLDAVMPVKDGNEAYEEIQNMRPGVKAVFMSGYNSNSAFRKSLAENKIELLLKPVTPGMLLSKIREVLDR